MEDRFLHTGAVQPDKREREPRAQRHWLVAGLVRLALILAVAVAASIVLGLLVGSWRDWETTKAIAMGLYIGGGALAGVGVLSWGGQGYDAGGYTFYESMGAGERMLHQNRMGAYVLIGLLVIGLGVLAEMFL
jgi:hypothetical protein